MTAFEPVIITISEAGERLDALLVRSVQGLSRSAAQRLIEDELVTIDGAPARKNHRGRVGEVVCATLPELKEAALEAEDIPLDTVYEDEDVIVINKPRGMVVHPAPGHSGGTLVNALLHHCGDSLSGVGGERRPGIVHRIDKDTSGLLIAAKNDEAHHFLSAQLADRSLSRIYEAIAVGGFKNDYGSVVAPIGRHPRDRKKMAVTQTHSRSAATHWEVIARYSGYTHLRCRLETGRTHQIRVHMAYIGRPLLGDEVYGGARLGKEPCGQFLHARELRFIHPRSEREMRLSTGLPEYFKDALHRIGHSKGAGA